jgi:multidrug efflux system outer membrane protein
MMDISGRKQTAPAMHSLRLSEVWPSGLVVLVLMLSACSEWFPRADLAPTYEPPQYVVPASWHGSSPFVEATPSDDALRPDWWKLYGDPVLDKLVEQAIDANPDLQAAAERFVQARDMMMKARAQYLPQAGIGFGGSHNRQSDERLFRPRAPEVHTQEATMELRGLASWEPDFWSALRNATRVETYTAQERAADWGLARLSLQAEVASDYFILRGFDAQTATYSQSIELYKQSLALVKAQFVGKLASALDVARVESLLYSTETKLAQIQGQRQVTEQAIAILVNRAPGSFTIDPVPDLRVASFTIPRVIPAILLERRPDIAASERRMAQANRTIGIARAAFFPNVSFRAGGGFEDGFDLIKLANSFWAYGSEVSLPVFQGGYRRAQLQQAWSAYRETEDRYRATVLNALREVENHLTLTNRLTLAANRQDAAVEATFKTQNLTTDLYRGGLASSLELIFAQVNTLEARIDSIAIKADLLKSSVELMRALGGGWDRKQLPSDDQIQPFGTFQYVNLDKPAPAGGIDVHADNNRLYNDLTKRP